MCAGLVLDLRVLCSEDETVCIPALAAAAGSPGDLLGSGWGELRRESTGLSVSWCRVSAKRSMSCGDHLQPRDDVCC